MSGESNGRIKLSWGQIAWSISLLVALGAAWYDMRESVAGVRTEITAMRTELGIRVQKADREHDSYERRLDRLEGRRAP